jgi:hypothetical protein
MNKDIRTQLLEKGFKESPLLLVERKYDYYVELSKQAQKATGNKLTAITLQATKLCKQINEICDSRKIGNPLKGEKIEWLDTMERYGIPKISLTTDNKGGFVGMSVVFGVIDESEDNKKNLQAYELLKTLKK